MMGISSLELIIVALIGLIFLGPEQMKIVVRFIARIIRGMKKVAFEVNNYLESSLEDNKK
jgi:Sec-independent protein translocase protein TatA